VDETAASPTFPSATGHIARLAYARGKAAGIALEPLLKATHLTASQLEDPHTRLKVSDQIQFLNLVSSALADDFLGFHLAQVPDLREFGLFYYVLNSAETLIDALQRAVRYSSILNEGLCLKVVEASPVGLSLRYIGINRHHDRHQIEFVLTSMIRIARQLTGTHLMPLRVRLIHARADYHGEFADFFGETVQFGAGVDEVILPPRVGNLPVSGADPYLNKLLVAYCEETIAKQPEHRGSFQTTVENAIIPLLPHGKARASEIARKLGVGQRTLARRLSAEGLTFSSLLEALRFNLANRYLGERQFSISQIAWLLGYKEIAGFSHAFKRWSGKTPRETRANQTRKYVPPLEQFPRDATKLHYRMRAGNP
jgi:AraC-like DNA-binding protein